MTKIIGLTGGIGSGKTTIANLFAARGIPIYIADDEARKIMDLPEIQGAIKRIFGKDVFDKNKLIREKLAQIVFSDPQKLNQLNSIIHPAVKSHFDRWLEQHSKFPFVIKEAAILFESGSYKDCDFVITVLAPLELRIERVMKRDKLSREQVLNRINNQWSDRERIEKSKYLIENTNIQKSEEKIEEILKKLTIP
jgi:dephospho-CoA kinase